ncbi:putative phospholipid transporting ATPase-like protein [Trypanosoma vivax]|nr:putative phospholipid transporting ATPase-like protein [Trypanosoma vivax]
MGAKTRQVEEGPGKPVESASFVEVNILRKDINETRKFPKNAIRSAKYTWLTCIPKSFLNQFYSVSNLYFLLIAILAIFPAVTSIGPYSTLVPLSVVLGIGMVRDLWEDSKRRRSDARVNAIGVLVLRGDKFVSVPSCEVCVGDVMLCNLGDEVLADAVLLNTSLADGVTYIETSNLDGETNAKARRARPETIESLGTVEDIIEHCLSDHSQREFFLRHGTTSKWKSGSRVSARADPFHGHVTNSGGQTLRENTPNGAIPGHMLQKARSGAVQNAPHGRSRSFNSSSHFPPSGNNGRAVHTRSNTPPLGVLGSSDGNMYHVRRHTFDECLAFEHEASLASNASGVCGGNEFVQRDRCVKKEKAMNGLEMTMVPSSGVAHRAANDGVGGTQCTTGEYTGVHVDETQRCSSGTVLFGSQPCSDLFSWTGQLRIPGRKPVSLSIEQFLPRGCIIRNTEWVLCVVMYTGSDTKIHLNLSRNTRKVSEMASRINMFNIFLLAIHQLTIVCLCGLGVYWKNSMIQAPDDAIDGHSAWYIRWALEQYSLGRSIFMMYMSNFVLLANFIPLSLYVTLELNKAIQMYLIANDRRMASYDEFNGVLRYSRPRTSELNSQLACVRYIFTDKTGTLTENLMTYVGGYTAGRRHSELERPGGLGEAFLHIVCVNSSSGACVRGDVESRGSQPIMSDHLQQQLFDFDEDLVENEPVFQYLRVLALCHSVVCFERPEVESAAAVAASSAGFFGGSSLNSPTNLSQRFCVTDQGPMGTHLPNEYLGEQRTCAECPSGASVFGMSSVSGMGRFLHGRTGSSPWFAARHSDMVTHQRTGTMSLVVERLKDQSKIYEGQSLDEVALVTAARDNLFTLQRRTARFMFVKVIHKLLCYEIIAELEFTPERKIMSVLLRRRPGYDHIPADVQESSSPTYRRSAAVHLRCKPGDPAPSQTPPVSHNSANSDKTQKPSHVEGRATGNIAECTSAGVCSLAQEEVERGPNSFLLLVKGADSSMMAIVNKDNPRNAKLISDFVPELQHMSSNGLRTLVLGQRYVAEEEVRSWLATFNEAQSCLQGRSEALHNAYALMERDIDLVGTTAVEDRLQDSVPETLSFFMQAGIVLWMLTGDKRETAVSIAFSSGLADKCFSDYVCHIDLSGAVAGFPNTDAAAADKGVRDQLEAQMDAAKLKCKESGEVCGHTPVVVLVVDGQSLDVIFSSKEYTDVFFKIGIACRSAICCRLTPSQKAQIVRLFQKTNSVALAIGDGANDVSMIRESRVGVGIMGLEGSQAELASDYAIPKFRFLKRLLAVHGRFSLYRDAHCFVFSIHKNTALTVGLVAFSFCAGFSGVLFVDTWLMGLYNLVYCALQPLIIGTFDKDVEDELAESVPGLYPPLAHEKMFFSWGYVIKWIVDAVVLGAAVFAIIRFCAAEYDEMYPSHSAAVEDYGTAFFILLLFVVNLRAAATMTCYNILTFAAIAFGFIAIPVITIPFSMFHSVLGSQQNVFVAMELMSMPKLWLMMLLSLGVFVVCVVGVNTYISLRRPWSNGEAAMKAAWESPFRNEYYENKRKLTERSAMRQ